MVVESTTAVEQSELIRDDHADALSDGSATISWSAPSLSHQGEPTKDVVLKGLDLAPGWYRLEVETTSENAIVCSRARFRGGRGDDLRIRLEATGHCHYRKILKTGTPLTLLGISVQGRGKAAISHIKLRPLGVFETAAFLAMKGIRYLAAQHRVRAWPSGIARLRSVLRADDSFAFCAQYGQANTELAYERWQAVHEDPDAGARAAQALGRALVATTQTVALLIPEGVDAERLFRQAQASLIGSSIELVMVPVTSVRGDGSTQSHTTDENWNFVLPFDYAGIFAPGAIERMVLAFAETPRLEAVFADSDTLVDGGGRRAPRLKPPWDRELLHCTDYIRAPLMVRWRSNLRPALALSGASRKPGYALALHLLELFERSCLARIPEILFHETDAEAQDTTAIDHQILRASPKRGSQPSSVELRRDSILQVDWSVPDPPPRVSVIIPSRDNPILLERCLASIEAHSRRIRPEILVADNDSIKPQTLDLLRNISRSGRARVVSCPGPFNFSKINNQARIHATGEILVFLNDDTRVRSADWLVELVGLTLRPEIGAVGPLLLYPDGRVQHAGVLIGIGGVADHAFRYLPSDSPGYLNLLRCRREVTAVTGACLAVRAELFDLVSGFDESLQVTLNDVDLCLRLRARGLINVWTPWVVLEHLESMSRGFDFTSARLGRRAAEIQLFRQRWSDSITRDPTYHPGLSDLAPDYSLMI